MTAASVATGSSLAVYACLSAFVFLCARRRPAATERARWPRVSVLKPMKELDDEFRANLDSFMRLDYPDYEIIFGLDEGEGPCADEARALALRYPAVPQKVVATGREKRGNPKIATLVPMEREASGELLWISDANTRVEPGTLKALAAEHLDNGTAIVFSPLRGGGSASFGSLIENSYISTFVSGAVLAAWALLKKPVIVGKSMLIDRRALASLGGFEAFRRYLAEDYMMGKIFAARGLRVATNGVWVDAVSSRTTVPAAFGRILRWAKMRRTIDPLAYALEPLTNPAALALLAAAADPARALPLAVGAFALTLALEYAALARLDPAAARDPRLLALYPAALLAKSALCAAAWLVPWFSTGVSWRGRPLRIGRDSVIEGFEEAA